MGVLYWERHRRGRSLGPRRRGGLPVDTPQLDGATPLCVAAPRKCETPSPGDIAAKSRSSQDVEVPTSKCAIPCGGCCGSPLGRGGPGGPSPSPARAPPRQRANFLATVEKALAKIRMFLVTGYWLLVTMWYLYSRTPSSPEATRPSMWWICRRCEPLSTTEVRLSMYPRGTLEIF